MNLKGKRAGLGLEMRTFQGTQGTFLVFRLASGAFHVFAETEAKAAAKDCGAKVDGNTRTMWQELWDR